ncbi:MAG TPA: DUF4118 domain-containing protein, partial [Armatimonadota bacterium]|nr:DUF4118 domain-containing protein [Armatimonadota bacterium]
MLRPRLKLSAPPPALAYGCALLSTAVATLLRMPLTPVLQDRAPFATYFLAVVVTAWYGGVGPGLCAILLGSLLGTYLFIPPHGSLFMTAPADQAAILVFAAMSTGFTLVVGRLRAARSETERTLRELREREQELVREVASRREAEEALCASRNAEQQLVQRLTALHGIGNELFRAASLDELCRAAVELGCSRLGFERLGLWFTGREAGVVTGSFGIDEEGALRDERGRRVALSPESLAGEVLSAGRPLALAEEVPIRNPSGEVIGRGTQAVAALWDGTGIIGFLSADNLLRGGPLGPRECELLTVYASSLGHLVSLRRAASALQESEERLQFALNAAGLSYWDWNVETGAVKWSAGLEPLHGMARGSFRGNLDAVL